MAILNANEALQNGKQIKKHFWKKKTKKCWFNLKNAK